MQQYYQSGDIINGVTFIKTLEIEKMGLALFMDSDGLLFKAQVKSVLKRNMCHLVKKDERKQLERKQHRVERESERKRIKAEKEADMLAKRREKADNKIAKVLNKVKEKEDRKAAAKSYLYKNTKEYHAWYNMQVRCYNAKSLVFKIYGQRGITVCERWRQSYHVFLEDMGYAPSTAHSIDRLDVNGNYEPFNCRWATQKEQTRNKRDTIYLTHEGVTKSIGDWSELTGIYAPTIAQRIKRGYPSNLVLSVNKINLNSNKLGKIIALKVK